MESSAADEDPHRERAEANPSQRRRQRRFVWGAFASAPDLLRRRHSRWAIHAKRERCNAQSSSEWRNVTHLSAPVRTKLPERARKFRHSFQVSNADRCAERGSQVFRQCASIMIDLAAKVAAGRLNCWLFSAKHSPLAGRRSGKRSQRWHSAHGGRANCLLADRRALSASEAAAAQLESVCARE